MDNLISVNVRIEKDHMITDSRNVADVFNKQHRHVLESIRNLEKDVPNFRQMFFEGTMPDSYGREQKVYFMTRDGFTLLAMGFTGSEAMKWKMKYIEAFNALEKAWNTPEQVMARALKIAAKQIEDLKESNLLLEKKIEEDKPKTIFADAVSSSDSSMLVRDLAKIIKQNGVPLGEKRFYQWLRNNGYICKGNTTPTQKAMELGLFEIIVRTVTRGNGLPIETQTTKITGKGQQYFINKFLA